MKIRVQSLTLLALGLTLTLLASPTPGDSFEDTSMANEPARQAQPPALSSATSTVPLCQTDAASLGESPPLNLAVTSYCEADCEDGSTISVNCPGTCKATNQSCPSTRGQVSCDGTVTDRCPVCDNSCTVSNVCPDGTYLQCSSSSGDCFGGQGLCFVRCDGVLQWCPGHIGQILC